MRVAPIIHTRTFSCDFNSEFLVKPDSFKNLDIKWARKNVLGATGEIDGLHGVRWLIADNGKYRMAGVIGFLKNICSKCQMSEKDKLKSEELFCDDKGRLVYAFIGVVIDKFYNDSYGTISIDYLWGIYLNKIYPIWKRSFQEVVLEEFIDVDTKLATNTISAESVIVGTKKLFESNAASDYELFSDILCNGNKTNFSFCSNILDFNMVKQSEFSIITTSQNIITRLSRENIVKPSLVSDEQPLQMISSENRTEPSQMPEFKKKSFVVLMICVMILLIVILMLLLIMKTDSDQDTIQHTSSQLIETIFQIQSQKSAEIMYTP